MNRFGRSGIAVSAIALITTGAFWFQYITYRQLQSTSVERAREAASGNIAMPLNGLRIDLSRPESIGLEVVDRSGPVRGPSTLLLVSSDTCAVCAKIMPVWMEMLSGIDPRTAVSIVTVDGMKYPHQLVSVLAKGRITYEVLKVTQVELFGRSTGLRGTPQAVVLNHDFRLRLLVGGLVRELEDTWPALVRKTLAEMNQ